MPWKAGSDAPIPLSDPNFADGAWEGGSGGPGHGDKGAARKHGRGPGEGAPQRSEWALKSERAGAAVATSGEGSRWLPSRKGQDIAQFCAN